VAFNSDADGHIEMNVHIYTANFGGYDRIRSQVEQDIDVSWSCFTDLAVEAPHPWRTEVVEPRYTHPNLAAKWWKTHPPDADFAIWIDANMRVTSSSFAREAIASVRDGLAIWKHPRRDCIYDEAEASLGQESQGGRYDGLPIREQISAYRAEGYPEHAGLYACGTIVWTPDAAATIGCDWMQECERWTYQDQLSFPVVCWRRGVTPGPFPLSQVERRYSSLLFIGNRWLKIDWKRAHLGNRWLRMYPHGS
jgi:hypothetical protein